MAGAGKATFKAEIIQRGAVDVFGKPCVVDGIRTEFKTFDVAWSFMRQYKKAYPLHNFALVSGDDAGKMQTVFRYI